jgi:nicotinamidase-related amidase
MYNERMGIQLSKAALLLVDMQNESQYGIDGLDAAVTATARVIAACRAAGIPVVYTRHVSRSDGIGLSSAEVLEATGVPVYYRSDTDAVNVIDEIAPDPGDIVIDKHRWSGFHATSLDLMLRSLGVRHLIVGGFTTDCCVMTTVFDAYALDYQVSLVKDMCAATNEGSHKAAVLMMANWVYGIEISGSTDLVKQLEGKSHRSWRSTAPDPKQFTAETLNDVYASLG